MLKAHFPKIFATHRQLPLAPSIPGKIPSPGCHDREENAAGLLFNIHKASKGHRERGGFRGFTVPVLPCNLQENKSGGDFSGMQACAFPKATPAPIFPRRESSRAPPALI